MVRTPRCKCCKRRVRSTSNKRLCAACSTRKVNQVVKQMRRKRGKYYKRWKQNLLEAIKKAPL